MRANPINRVAAICLLTVAGAFAVKAAAPPTPQGVITVKEFLDITGTALTALTGSPKFPDNPDIVAIAVADGGVRRVTTTESAEYQPKWSPDGKRIAHDAGSGGATGDA